LSNSTTSWRSPAVSRLRAFARIMDHPPSSTLQSRLTRFGRELPGASGPDAILDLLLAHVRAAWDPRELAARWERTNGTAARSHWPHPPRNRDAVLSLTADRGSVLLTSEPPDEQPPEVVSPLNTGPWLVVPLLGTDSSAGAPAVRRGPGR